MRILTVLFLILGLTAFALGQEKVAILSGSVYDAQGSLIANAKITAINQKMEKFVALTNSLGVYQLKLPFKQFDSTKSSNFRIEKYVLLIEAAGFEQFVMKGLNFVPSTYGKMALDFALDSLNPAPCGYSGADCLENLVVETAKPKMTKEILKKPLQELPKANNKINKEKQ